MSVPVDLAALRAQIARYGAHAFLVTTADGAPPHLSSVLVDVTGDDLAMGCGKTTRANVDAHPAVSLLWAPGPDLLVALASLAAPDALVAGSNPNPAASHSDPLVPEVSLASYCLIVDAVAQTVERSTLTVRPTAAVLHRVAGAPAGLPRCLPLEPTD